MKTVKSSKVVGSKVVKVSKATKISKGFKAQKATGSAKISTLARPKKILKGRDLKKTLKSVKTTSSPTPAKEKIKSPLSKDAGTLKPPKLVAAPVRPGPTKRMTVGNKGDAQAKLSNSEPHQTKTPGPSADKKTKTAGKSSRSQRSKGASQDSIGDFLSSEALPASARKFRQSPEIEGFYRFIFENDLRVEAVAALAKILKQRKSKTAPTV